jgi:hypothetical protein
LSVVMIRKGGMPAARIVGIGLVYAASLCAQAD